MKQNYKLCYIKKNKLMNSKYKIMKYHGFNPFKSKESRELSELMQKDAAELQKLRMKSKLSMKEIALILQGQSQINPNDKLKQNQKNRSLVTENYELHQLIDPKGNHIEKTKIVMFNQRQFCQKKFDYAYAQNELQQKQNQLYQNILTLSQKKQSKQNSRLIIYLANSQNLSQKVILGHNQTQNNQQNSFSLLKAVYQKMVEEKTEQNEQNPSSIYFSAIGIQKENNLYDLLNEEHIHDEESTSKVPPVRVRKILRQHDSIIAENLKKEIIKDQARLDELIQRTKEVKNFIEFYENFDETFFMGELYHFYQANQNYDLFNQCVILKINQHLPKLPSSTPIDGFYERRLKQSNSSRIATLIMRIGLNIKACRKNKLQRQASLSFMRKHSSQVQMHESKILLYLGPVFMNLATEYVLVNELGNGESIGEEINKLQLNRGFRTQKHPNNLKLADFYHTKHYLDLPEVKEIVKSKAVKFLLNNQNKKISLNLTHNLKSRFSLNSTRQRAHPEIVVQEQVNEEQKILQSMKGKKFSKTSTYRTFDPNRQKSLFHEGQKVKSKSFFCHTISSSQRNYWKSIDRQIKQIQKDPTLIDIGKLLYDGSGNDINGKTINSKTQMMKFVDDRSLVRRSLEGVRVTYKRRMVVKTIGGTEEVQ